MKGGGGGREGWKGGKGENRGCITHWDGPSRNTAPHGLEVAFLGARDASAPARSASCGPARLELVGPKKAVAQASAGGGGRLNRGPRARRARRRGEGTDEATVHSAQVMTCLEEPGLSSVRDPDQEEARRARTRPDHEWGCNRTGPPPARTERKRQDSAITACSQEDTGGRFVAVAADLHALHRPCRSLPGFRFRCAAGHTQPPPLAGDSTRLDAADDPAGRGCPVLRRRLPRAKGPGIGKNQSKGKNRKEKKKKKATIPVARVKDRSESSIKAGGRAGGLQRWRGVGGLGWLSSAEFPCRVGSITDQRFWFARRIDATGVCTGARVFRHRVCRMQTEVGQTKPNQTKPK